MEKKMMVGVAALALLAVAALSIVGTFAYPAVVSTITASASGICDQDMLRTRLQTQDRICDGTCDGTCNGTTTRETAQIRSQDRICENQGVDCNGTQYQLMQQSRECLSLGEETQQNALHARNQIMAQIGNDRP